jgi:predicted RNA-binding protein Jag
VPIHIIKSNTATQVREALARVYEVERTDEVTQKALSEAMDGIRRVKATGRPVELSPQNAYLRRLQHQVVAEHELTAKSAGKEPARRLRITPPEVA